MQINKDLELPFEYSWNLVKLLVIIMIIIGVVLLFDKFLLKKFRNYTQKITLPYLKNWYLRKLEHLLNNVSNNKIKGRDAYLKLSSIIREFIERATGLNILSITKEEAKAMGMKNLSLLMEEYYPPEFSQDSAGGDIINSIKRTIDVIRNWN